MKYLLFLLGLIVILVTAYYSGCINQIKNWKQVQDGDIEMIDQCFQKEIKGEYSMTILFDRSENTKYENQKLEIYYTIDLTKDRCDIVGEGNKTGFSLIDTITGMRSEPIDDIKEVIIDGLIRNDTLNINMRFKTNSLKDCKVTAFFPYKTRKFSVLEGTFIEKCDNSEGTAKLAKREKNKMNLQ